MKSTIIPIAFLFATLAATPMVLNAQAQAQEAVYTWVDANGTRHYSQTPPRGVKYETRGIRTAPVALEEGGDADKATQTPEEIRACERARIALEQLNSSAPVFMARPGETDPAKASAPLNDEERAKQKENAERAVRAYCIES